MTTIPQLYNIYLQYPNVVTDTRSVKPGDVFFALKGPNFNGNNYAKAAIQAGAAYCVCDEVVKEVDDNKIIYVPDVLTALQALAKHHRQQLNIPMLAITGSNGKTTTKELIHEVLSTTLTCYTTKGNLNNHIGVPLTILTIKLDAQFAVIEMGANHLKEIEGYCQYAMPTHGLITNCGKAHLEGFGSEENIKKAKGELFDYLAKNNGIAFINTDYQYLKTMSKGITNTITYGTANATYKGTVANNEQMLQVTAMLDEEQIFIQTQLAGQYNLPNVLSAIAVGKTFGVSNTNIKKALEQYTPSNSRSQIIKQGSNTIILDAYNANPSSMKVAVENFATIQSNNKILILGGMAELGVNSLFEHASLIQLIQKYNWAKVIVAGNDYKNLPKEILHFNDAPEIANWFKTQQFTNAHILIKGSRSMAMEKVIS